MLTLNLLAFILWGILVPLVPLAQCGTGLALGWAAVGDRPKPRQDLLLPNGDTLYGINRNLRSQWKGRKLGFCLFLCAWAIVLVDQSANQPLATSQFLSFLLLFTGGATGGYAFFKHRGR